jgi:hypothetical protein
MSKAIFLELRKAEVQLPRTSLMRSSQNSVKAEVQLPRIPILGTWVNSALEELEDGLVDRAVPFDS